jgi:endo-alpha-1,4-polygalactosaminidase (GH114 family)
MDLEQKKALETYGHFNSTHEVYGVLMEEVNEFFEVVREKPNTPNKSKRMIEELNQIRAISERAMNELKNNQIKFV